MYDNLIKDLSLNASEVPLLAEEVVHADQGGSCAAMNSIIAKLPQTLPNSYVVSSAGCTDTTDNLHFNAAGYRELGKRYRQKMLSLLDITPSGTGSELFNGYNLNQNVPNPFYGKTNISFEIPKRTYVSLKVFDSSGAELAELAGKQYLPDRHTVEFNNKNLSKGIYFYTMQAGMYSANRKMVIYSN